MLSHFDHILVFANKLGIARELEQYRNAGFVVNDKLISHKGARLAVL